MDICKIVPRLAILILFLLLSYLLITWPNFIAFISYDTWWHLSLGKNANIGNLWVDTLAYTNINGSNASHSWLYDYLIFYLYNNYSIAGLLTLVPLSLIFFIYLQNQIQLKLNGNIFLNAVVLIFACWIQKQTFLIRPQQFTPILVSLLLLLLLNVNRKFSKYLFILLFCVWANLHGSFLFGLFIIVLSITFNLIFKSYKSFEEYQFLTGLNNLKYLIQALIFAITGSLCHPQFYYVFSNALGHTPVSNEIMSLINEWAPISGLNLFLLITLLILFIFSLKSPKYRNITSIYLLIFLILPLLSARLLTPSIAIVLPVIISRVSSCIKIFNFKLNSKSNFNKYYILCALVYILLVFSNYNYKKISSFELINILSNTILSYELPLEEVKSLIRIEDTNIRIFNFYEHGGFINFISDGKIKVFIDSRMLPFLGKTINDYMQFVDSGCTDKNIIYEYKFTHYIGYKDCKFNIIKNFELIDY
jgi:hypothetical protein